MGPDVGSKCINFYHIKSDIIIASWMQFYTVLPYQRTVDRKVWPSRSSLPQQKSTPQDQKNTRVSLAGAWGPVNTSKIRIKDRTSRKIPTQNKNTAYLTVRWAKVPQTNSFIKWARNECVINRRHRQSNNPEIASNIMSTITQKPISK